MKRSIMIPACAFAIAALAVGCAKNNSSNGASAAASPEAAAPAAASPAGSSMASSNGATVFASNCAACHQAKGQGLAGAYPPLANNPVVTGPATHVIHILKYGLNGKVQVAGKTYNGMMPAWNNTLSNADIASVITYVRESWGNHAGAVTTAQVAAVKK